MSRGPNRPMLKRYPAFLVAAVVLAALLSACGSSSSGGSTTEHVGGDTTAPTSKAPTSKAPASEPEAGAEEARAPNESDPEIVSIIKREIYGRWGGPTEFKVAGGVCKVDKINTSEAAIKAGGEAVLDAEHNASVLVTPLKGKRETATAAECQEAVAIAIG